MLRSVVVPGWGQWANHRHVKALVVAVGESYLLYRAIDWRRQEMHAQTLARRYPDATIDYLAEAEHASTHRRDFTWWTIFAGAFSMGDAYVDAQLGRHFDAQFKPQDASSYRQALDRPARPLAEISWTAALRFRFP